MKHIKFEQSDFSNYIKLQRKLSKYQNKFLKVLELLKNFEEKEKLLNNDTTRYEIFIEFLDKINEGNGDTYSYYTCDDFRCFKKVVSINKNRICIELDECKFKFPIAYAVDFTKFERDFKTYEKKQFNHQKEINND